MPSISSLAVSGSVLYIGGHFAQVDGATRTGAAAIDMTSGTLLPWDPGFPIGSGVTTLATGGTTVYVGGSPGLRAVDATTGAAVPGFSVTLDSSPTSLLVSGSILYVGGYFSTVNGSARRGLAAISVATGSLLPLGADVGAGEWVNTLALDGTTLYVGGDFNSLGGIARRNLGALDVASGSATAFDPGVSGEVFALLVQGSTIYAGGDFSHAGGQARANLVALTATASALNWNPGLNGSVTSLAASGGVVAAGGYFTHFGAVPRDGLAAVDLVTGDLTSLAPSIVADDFSLTVISALEIAGDTLYLGGAFTSVNGVARTNLAALDVRTATLLPWNPVANDFVESIVTVGGTAYVAGQFTTIAGVARHSLAALDATTGADLGWDAGVTGGVHRLEVVGTTLYAGGSFSQLGGQPRSNLGAFDLGTRALTSFNPGVTGTSAFVSGLDAEGNALYVSGRISGVGGQGRTFAAAVDRVSGTPLPFAPVVAGIVSEIAVSDDVVYLSGLLESVNGEVRRGLAAVDAATGLTTLPFDPAAGVTDAGAFHLRADHDLLFVGLLSNEVPLRPGLFPAASMGGAPGRPMPPVPLVSAGTAIAMHWRPSPIGGEPTSYVVEAGTTPGSANIGTLPTSGPLFSFAGVPPGRYYLRVRARNGSGTSPASPEIAVVFGNVSCGTVPLPVTAGATVSGSTVTITWPDAVGANGTYALAAGTGPGLSNIATLGMGATRELVTDAPAGLYYARVVADGACGQAAPGPDTVISVGGAMPFPSPSIGGQVAGGTVTISWPVVPGATRCRLDAGSGPLLANVASVPTAATSLVANGVPAGTYYVRVYALAGGSVSPASNELVVMVP